MDGNNISKTCASCPKQNLNRKKVKLVKHNKKKNEKILLKKIT